MAFDEKLAARMRTELADQRVEEKKMFGGLTFMVDGHMCCGIGKGGMMVRVGPDAYDKAVAMQGARPMDITGRHMKGLVWVDPATVTTKKKLSQWINRGVAFVGTLPRRTK